MNSNTTPDNLIVGWADAMGMEEGAPYDMTSLPKTHVIIKAAMLFFFL